MLVGKLYALLLRKLKELLGTFTVNADSLVDVAAIDLAVGSGLRVICPQRIVYASSILQARALFN